MNKQYEFDVAFSFAGEQREYVRKVYNYVEDHGVKVFYDVARKTEMWGENLVEYFQDVFQTNAKFCVMFISKDYKEKIWTKFERQIIQARSLVDEGYVLPVRFDDTEIEGLLPTIGYINASALTPEELGDLIIKKVKDRKTKDITATPQITFRQPKIKKSFNPYEEAQEWIDYLSKELRARADRTTTVELSCSVFVRDGTHCFRFVQDGNTVYSLNISMGGISGDKGLSFLGNSGEISGGRGSSNAWGDFEWDKEQEMVVLLFHDMSLFTHYSNDEKKYTKEEFADKIWEKVVSVIEEE